MAIINRTKSNNKTSAKSDSDSQRKPWEPRLAEITETLTRAGAEKAARVAEIGACLTEVNNRIEGAESRLQNPTDAKDYAAAKREKADAEAEAEYYRSILAQAQDTDAISEGEWLKYALECDALAAQPRAEWQRIAAPILADLAKAWATYTKQYECFTPAVAALNGARPKVVHYNGGIVSGEHPAPNPDEFDVAPSSDAALRDLYTKARDLAKRAGSML